MTTTIVANFNSLRHLVTCASHEGVLATESSVSMRIDVGVGPAGSARIG
jgi:hypothetical protein